MSEETAKPQEFYLNSKLLDVFEDVGAIPKKYNSIEILHLLRKYLDFKPHLIDPNNGLCVNCEDDKLGKALGVNKFEFHEIRSILIKNIIPVSDVVPYRPKGAIPKGSYSLNSTSSTRDNDDNSLSETEIINSNFTEPGSDHSDEEYELITDNDESIIDVSDSEADSFICGIVVADTEFEDDFYADESDTFSNHSSDNSIDNEDLWRCLTCGISNRPYMRYCEKCWKERKEWLPERPSKKRKNSKKPKNRQRRKNQSKKNNNTAPLDSTNNSESSVVTDLLSPPNFNSKKSTEISPTSTEESLQDTSQESITKRSEILPETSIPGTSFQTIPGPSISKKRVKRRRKNSRLSDEPPRKITTVSPKSVPSNYRKFRKFLFTEEGTKWMSGKGKSMMHFLDNMSSDSESEVTSRKFQNFCTKFSGRKWLQSEKSSKLFDVLDDHTDLNAEDIAKKSICTICYCRKADTGLVHANFSHVGFCYPCAKRSFNSKSKCPACRRPIERITKISFG